MSNVPEDLRYTSDHEWVRTEDGGRIRIGITDYAQDALGDVVFVQLPEPGAKVEAGGSFSEVESTKSVSDIYAPLAGTVVARNEALNQTPEVVNSDPYGEGWLMRVRLEDPAAADGLLDATTYSEQVAG